jgi:hypothetical protein
MFLFVVNVVMATTVTDNVFDGEVYDVNSVEQEGDEPIKGQNNKLVELHKSDYTSQNNARQTNIGKVVKAIDDGPITAHQMMNYIFGTPIDGGGLLTYMTQSNPVSFIKPFLELLISIAGWALAFVFLITAIRASFDMGREYEFLGKSISTPFFFMRIFIATLFLMPTGNGYTVLQTAILYANGAVIDSLDSVYGEVVDKFVSLDSIENNNAPLISRIEYQALLYSAICSQVLKPDKILSNITSTPNTIDGSNFNPYESKGGKELLVNGKSIYGKADSWFGSFFGKNDAEGACGAYTFSATLPVVKPENPSVISELNENIKSQITQVTGFDNKAVTAAFSASDEYQFTVTGIDDLEFFKGAKTLTYIAKKLLSGEEYKPLDFKIDFDKSWAVVNRDISFHHKFAMNKIRCLITSNTEGISNCSAGSSSLVEKIKDEVKTHGWLMAGADLFKIMTVQSSLTAINNIKFTNYNYDTDVIGEDSADDVAEYANYVASILNPSGNSGGSSKTAGIADFNPSLIMGEPEPLGDPSVLTCFIVGFQPECMSRGYFNKARSLAYALGHGTSTLSPLNLLHSYGVTGFNDVKNSFLAATVEVSVIKFIGYVLIGLDSKWTTPVGNTFVDLGDRQYGLQMSILKAMGAIFLVFAWFFPMAPLVAWVIGITEWALTMMIMIFAAPLFAVFHALPDGQGFSSQFAQRGYPSLLGAIFFPYFLLLGLFLFVVLSFVALKVLGWVFFLGFNNLYQITEIGITGAIFMWGILLVTIVMVFNQLISLITNFPDRVLRILGVNEALSSGASHQEVAQKAQGQAEQISSGAGDLAKPIAAGIQRDSNSEPPSPNEIEAQGHTKAGGGNVGGGGEGGGGNDTPSASQTEGTNVSNVDKAQSEPEQTNSKLTEDGFYDTSGKEASGKSEKAEKGPIQSNAKAPLGQRIGVAMKHGAMGALGAGSSVRGDAKREINKLNAPYQQADIDNQKAKQNDKNKQLDAQSKQESEDKQAQQFDEAPDFVDKNLQNTSPATTKESNPSNTKSDVERDVAGSQQEDGKMGDVLGGYDYNLDGELNGDDEK